MNLVKFRYSSLLSWVFLMGVMLRAFVYFQIPAVWLDEASTANKLSLVPLELLIQPGGGNYELMHAYPAGFLAVIKWIVSWLGFSEPSLRLFPMICSLLSVYFFRQLSRMILNRPWGLVALVLFSVNPALIYHSVEIKPYASDVMIAVFLALEASRVICGKHPRSLIYYFNLFVFALLFSFPAVFLIFPWLTVYGVFSVWKRNWNHVMLSAMLLLTAGLIQIGYFFVSLQYFFHDSNLIEYWDLNYLPISRGFAACWSMLTQNFFEIFQSWGLDPLIPLICLWAGLAGLGFQNRRYAVLLVLPVLAVLGASALHLYPFVARTALFLSPFLILLIVFGLQGIAGVRLTAGRAGAVVALTCLLIVPSALTSARMVQPFTYGEDMRPLLGYLADHRKDGEGLYLNAFAYKHFCYYNYIFGGALQPYNGLFGDAVKTDWSSESLTSLVFDPVSDDLLYLITEEGRYEQCHDGRFHYIHPGCNWFLFVHSRAGAREITLSFLDHIGHCEAVYRSDHDAVLYRYRINQIPINSNVLSSIE